MIIYSLPTTKPQCKKRLCKKQRQAKLKWKIAREDGKNCHIREIHRPRDNKSINKFPWVEYSHKRQHLTHNSMKQHYHL